MANTRRADMRLDDETDKLLGKLTEHLGVNRTSVVKQAIRELARKEGIAQKEITMNKLQYNPETNNYEHEYEDGRKLSVNGDRWAEVRRENVLERLAQWYPDRSQEEIETLLDTPAGEQAWKEVTNEELDVDEWELVAISLEPGEERPAMNAAWIQ